MEIQLTIFYYYCFIHPVTSEELNCQSSSYDEYLVASEVINNDYKARYRRAHDFIEKLTVRLLKAIQTFNRYICKLPKLLVKIKRHVVYLLMF